MPSLNKNATEKNRLKQAAGIEAAALVEDGMRVGLGTGTTAAFFIQALIERCDQGLSITTVATSVASEIQAQKGGLTVLNINEVEDLDLTVDGADEVDPLKRLIKGGGGALLREKIVAKASRQLVIITDESKLVPALGNFPLPVEIVPFGYQHTLRKLNELGFNGELRQASGGGIYSTDNHNYIYDIHFDEPIESPEQVDAKIQNVVGVVETGFFFDMASKVLVAEKSGNILVKD